MLRFPFAGMCAVALLAIAASCARADVLYFNGFETDTSGWSGATRVPSGTNGVPSSSGSFHAVASGTSFTTFGGYNFGAGGGVPTAFQPYSTSIDIYLNVAGGAANNTRFDFSSAISNAAGNHLRDFIFNAGFYNAADSRAPGAGADRFIISASNNSQPGSAFPNNPARDPIAITNSGWYTFTHDFYDNGGVLAVDLSIFDESNNLIHQWTLSDPTDLIAGVGGSRYGWFDFNEFGTNLPFDNSTLTTPSIAAVPEPTSIAVFSAMAVSGAYFGWRRRQSKVLRK